MRKIDEIAQEAMDLLKKHGVESAMIIAKCPDGYEIALNINGNKAYILEVNEICRDIIKGEIYRKNIKPPPPPPEKEGWQG